jgi:hypothetical protein
VEAGFVDLGGIAGPLTDSSGVTIANAQLQFLVKGETLAAVGMLPLGRWDLFLKGGVFFAHTQLQVAGTDTSSQTQHALFGFGLDRYFGENWRTRVGFTDYLSVGNTAQLRSIIRWIGVDSLLTCHDRLVLRNGIDTLTPKEYTPSLTKVPMGP